LECIVLSLCNAPVSPKYSTVVIKRTKGTE
jgi:hypothetical protein